MALSDEDQERRRAWFREHWQHGVAFNAHCGMTVRRWDPDGIEMHLPFADHLSAHNGIFHGGVISALIDTAGCGAVAAGHDFNLGSRITTISLAVQYFSVAPGEGALARARCTRRGPPGQLRRRHRVQRRHREAARPGSGQRQRGRRTARLAASWRRAS